VAYARDQDVALDFPTLAKALERVARRQVCVVSGLAGACLPSFLPLCRLCLRCSTVLHKCSACLPSLACCQACLNHHGPPGPPLLQLDGSHEERTFFMTRRDL
jgi:hypothetical protein